MSAPSFLIPITSYMCTYTHICTWGLPLSIRYLRYNPKIPFCSFEGLPNRSFSQSLNIHLVPYTHIRSNYLGICTYYPCSSTHMLILFVHTHKNLHVNIAVCLLLTLQAKQTNKFATSLQSLRNLIDWRI